MAQLFLNSGNVPLVGRCKLLVPGVIANLSLKGRNAAGLMGTCRPSFGSVCSDAFPWMPAALRSAPDFHDNLGSRGCTLFFLDRLSLFLTVRKENGHEFFRLCSGISGLA